MSEAARSRRDGTRYEPQLEVPGRDASPRQQSASDPLAELARLIGQDDPYRDVFRPAAPRGVAPAAFQAEDRHAQVDGHDDLSHHGEAHAAPAVYDGHGEPDDHDRHVAEDDHYDDGHPPQAYGDHAAYYDDHAGAGYATAEGQHPTYADDAGMADQRLAEDAVGASAIPDLWARGEEVPHWTPPEADHAVAPADRRSVDRSAARRPIAVLSAVLLLTCGGLAATFLAKGAANNAGTASAGGSRGAPTILAASGPTKVKVDDGSATAPEDRDAALLNGAANVSSGPVKVVSSEEQPTDLSLLPKSDMAKSDMSKSDLASGARPLPPAVPSPFPEPKRVKTFVVRPDGTMLSADGTPVPAGTTAATGTPTTTAALAAPADDAAASPLPATPTTAAKGGTTPQQPVMLGDALASLTADPAADDTAAKTERSPRAAARPGPAKPARVAVASAPSGGSYGLQLASSPIEAEANGAFAKLKRKFPEQLGAYTASVHKFETGDKPVYRVRVGGMSQEEAKTLCSQLQSAGGTCFVVRN